MDEQTIFQNLAECNNDIYTVMAIKLRTTDQLVINGIMHSINGVVSTYDWQRAMTVGC